MTRISTMCLKFARYLAPINPFNVVNFDLKRQLQNSTLHPSLRISSEQLSKLVSVPPPLRGDSDSM